MLVSKEGNMTKGKWLTAGLLLALGTTGVLHQAFVPGAPTESRAGISIDPSRTDQRFGVLAEPLVAFSQPSASETHDLERAISRFRATKDVVQATSLDGFLKKYPQSAWRVSLLTNMGLAELHEGFASRAIVSFRKAWQAGEKAKTPAQKAIRDRALGELLTLETRLGHIEKVKALLAAIGTRKLTGSASEDLASARAGLWELEHSPATSNRCGAAALEAVAKVEKMAANDLQRIYDAKAGSNGMSLSQLVQLAAKAHLPSRVVYRTGGEPVPVPSVVHWKENHYGAIVAERNGLYRLKDPMFDHDHWVTRAAVDSESSGYFLVPGETGDPVWRRVAAKEAAQVVGAGYTTKNDKGATATDDKKKNDKCDCKGMAKYDVHLMLVSLNINDNPVGYTPPKGPAVPITLSYLQREAYEPANFSYFNLGHKWTFNWQSFVKDDPNHPGQTVSIGLPGGGTRSYGGYDSTTGAFAREERTGAELVRTSGSPFTYERRMSDGTVYVYGASDGSTSYPRRVFLTQKIDPAGNAVTLAYDSQMRLTTITDALGQQTTFDYANSTNPLLITAVTDPFGRQASIEYDASGRLAAITDEIGLRSEFGYGSGTFINAMTTPYGTTHFAAGTNGQLRWLNITDPKGQTERFEFRHNGPGIPFSVSQVPTGIGTFNAYLNERNTFYWDKSAWARARGDYTKARIYHWLHKAPGYSTTSGVLESVKEPLESRVWYNYPGQVQPGATYALTGSLDKPSAIARVLDDGSTQLTQISYNDKGNITKRIDPVGRELDYDYAPNGRDVLKVTRKTATGFDTIAQYTYNDQYEPLTYIDAAGQTTTYTYNAAGQLTSTTDPLGNTTINTYDSNGYLTAVTNANGKVAKSYTYDAFGRIASSTDSEGYVLAYTYDNLNRLTAVTYPDGSQRTITWDKLDPVVYTDREGRTTTYAYDSIREKISTTSPMGHVTSYAYEANGQLMAITDPNSHTTLWTHDIQGRVIAKQYADGTSESYAYERRGGQLISVTDALGQTKNYTYAHDDRLAGIQYLNAVNPTPAVSYTYDPDYPRLTAVSDGIGTTSYQYYPAGVLGSGKLESKQGPRGHDTVSYAYDANTRLSSRAVDGAAETFSYDAINRETGHSNPLGDFTMIYLGQSNQLAERDVAGVPYRVRYDYESNLNDRRLKDIYNETTLNGSTQPVEDYAFTTGPEGLILSRTENNGSTTTAGGHRHYGWDNGRHVGWDHSHHWGVLTWLLGVEPGEDDDHHPAHHRGDSEHGHRGHGDDHDGTDRDARHHRHHHGDRDDDDGQGGTAPVATNYTYDNDLRLTGATGGLTESYAYDPANNITSISSGAVTTNITVNSVNAIQNAGGIAYVYDANGNILDDGKRVFAWDAENRLIRITDKVTGHVSAFTYDGWSHRAANTETDSGGMPVETRYLWCRNSLCEKRDAMDNVLARYYRQGELQGSQAYYYAQDQLGSVVALADVTGNIVGQTKYNSFGIMSSSTDTASDYRYAGLYFHNPSGLSLSTYRAYSGGVGRFLNRDPIGEIGGNNFYAYATDNPVRSVDWLGLASLVTDMQAGTTTFDPRPEDPNGTPISIPTSNNVDHRALPGARDAFSTPDVNVLPRTNNPASYGTPGAYIDTGDPRGRDIHGGGSCPANNFGDPLADRQGWCPTFGCTRGQNEDVKNLGDAIGKFKKSHPGTKIPYTRGESYF
jgi:RHS repeat-associated protein